MSLPPGSVPDGEWGHDYPYPPTGQLLTSITTMLGATEGKPWLPGWASGLTAGYSVGNLETLARVKVLQGSDKAIALAAREGERIRDRKKYTGGYVHDVLRALILWQASPDGHGGELVLPDLPERLAGEDYDGIPVKYVSEFMIDGFLNWVADFGPEFIASEMTVYNLALGLAGTLDIIARIPGFTVGRTGVFIPGSGVQVCVDAKTGKNLSVTWREQVAFYRRCPECSTPLGEMYATPPTEAGAVLHLRPEFVRGYQFMPIAKAEDAAAWNTCRDAARMYFGRKAAKEKPGRVCRPLRADGTIPPPLLADLDGEGYGRGLVPLRKAGITDLEQVAGMTAGQLLKIKGVGKKLLNDQIRVMLTDYGLHLAGEAPKLAEVA